jgi:hypothetical protein
MFEEAVSFSIYISLSCVVAFRYFGLHDMTKDGKQ